jgi:hypothetical protein
MPIQINLLTEALAKEDLRKRDPVKRLAYAGTLAIVLMLVWYSYVSLQHIVNSSNLSRIQAAIQAHANDYNKVTANLKDIANKQTAIKSLNDLSSARFLQANLMNALQQLYVTNVSLIHMDLSQTYALKDKSVVQQIILNLNAKDSSPNPGDQVNKYKDAISKLSYFKKRIISNDSIKLTDLSPPESDTDQKPFVLFTVECQLTEPK